MTDEELTANLRQILEQEILPELRASNARLDQMRSNMEQSSQRILARLQGLQQDMMTMRADLAATRAELKATQEEVFGELPSSRLIQ